jgi:hypothetical protein
MANHIRLRIGAVELDAELNDSQAAEALFSQLPMEVSLSRWGEEYYGACGVSVPLAPEAREEMEVGELAYWPPGKALCVFFGPTPASVGDEPRAASPVNPLGRLLNDPAPLRGLGLVIKVQVEATK